MREGESLYLWLQVEGEPEPRAYRLPWDQRTAQQLQRALEEAQRNGTEARMRLPFEPTLDAPRAQVLRRRRSRPCRPRTWPSRRPRSTSSPGQNA